MKGEIRRFYWKVTYKPYIFIPCVGLIAYFGTPVGTGEGIAELAVRIVDPQTGAVLAEYDKISKKTEVHTIYSGKAGEAGSELAAAFREVSKQINDSIVADIKGGFLTKPSKSGERKDIRSVSVPPS